mgnify:CR=1 FL=1
MFCRYSLRTTDVSAARAFYAETIGLALSDDGLADGSALEVWPLQEQAIARGAPAHWLGQLAVSDLEATVAHLVTLGGERLGPTVKARNGTTFAPLRDPFGAVIAVCAREQSSSQSTVVWHQLHTRDLDGSWTLYHGLFGWAQRQRLELPDPVGGFCVFAWNGSGGAVGAMGNTARQPGVHAHWQFFFPVANIDEASARVRTLGGTAMEPFTLPSGMRLTACEDPQGAAFGLAQGA